MKDTGKMLEGVGIPGRDLYDLPSSTHAFPDGAHYRMEVSGVERVSTLEALLEAMDEYKVPVHRIISTVMGATFLTRPELREFATMARDAGLEVIMTPGPRALWEIGKQVGTPEGGLSGMRLRGCDGLRQYLTDINRCLEEGIRGFLVWDEGALMVLDELRQRGDIPKETVFKVSIFAGHANPAGARLLEKLGANTFNPVADMTLPMLASVRSVATIPMDVHVVLFDSFGGHVRIYDCPEIARVASPAYFKIEPGPSVGALYKPLVSPDVNAFAIKEKVKQAAIIREIMDSVPRPLVLSKQGPDDLSLPRP